MLERSCVSSTCQYDDRSGICEFAPGISEFGFVIVLCASCLAIALTRFGGHHLRRLGVETHVRMESRSLHASMRFLCAPCFAVALARCGGQPLRRRTSLTHDRFCKTQPDDCLETCASMQESSRPSVAISSGPKCPHRT